MIKKICLTIFFIFLLGLSSLSKEVFKITSVSFDTSNSLIFLTSPDNTTDEIMKNVKIIKMQNPKRIYFDIDSAILTSGAQNWFLNSGGVKQVKISQFSTNPSRIRVVLYLDENFDQSKITYLKVNNNLVIKFKDGLAKQDYFQNTYRDERKSSSDFYENLAISEDELVKTKTIANYVPNDVVFNQIQQSFNVNVSANAAKPNTVAPATSDKVKKELKLKSKYFMDTVSIKDSGFLLSGFGSMGVEKPMYLTNPARVVFDIPNSIVNQDIINRDFKIGQDVLRISQYMPNKVRVVIVSPELEKYFPIFSADGQSALFVKSENFDYTSLFTKVNDALSYSVKNLPSGEQEFLISFNSPVVHSIKRDSSKLVVNFYNTLRFNESDFKTSVKNSGFEDMKIDLLPKVGLKLSLPLEKTYTVNCYMGADGRSVKVIGKGFVKKVKPQVDSEDSKFVVLPKRGSKIDVVLDAGHGGTDYGAIRAGVNEKDINLDIIKRVQAILNSKNISASLTRDNDEFISLQERTVICASCAPKIFVSVHVNSSAKPEINGVETHYYHQQGLELANTVHSSLVSCVNAKDRGLFKSKFYVINHTDVPAILVEIGFISNEQERAELVSEKRKQQTAKAIADGIIKYLKSN